MEKPIILEQIFEINKIYANEGKTYPYSQSWFEKEFKKGTIVYIEEDNEVVGFAVYDLNDSYKEFVAVSLIAIKPEFLRKQYGVQLMKMIKEKFKNKTILLNVYKENSAAIKFYHSMGFIKSHDKDNKIIMRETKRGKGKNQNISKVDA